MTALTNRRTHRGARLTHTQMKLAVVITLAINIAAFVCQVML